MDANKEMEIKCEGCAHVKADHYMPVKDPENNPKAETGVCKCDGCDCEKFTSKATTKWEAQPKHDASWKSVPKSPGGEWKAQPKSGSTKWEKVPRPEPGNWKKEPRPNN